MRVYSQYTSYIFTIETFLHKNFALFSIYRYFFDISRYFFKISNIESNRRYFDADISNIESIFKFRISPSTTDNIEIQMLISQSACLSVGLSVTRLSMQVNKFNLTLLYCGPEVFISLNQPYTTYYRAYHKYQADAKKAEFGKLNF